jgi:Mn2+/Fe2+ NRAMP family transporter
MAVMMLMSANPKVMGEFVIGPRLKMLGWAATAVMGVAVVFMLLQMLF